MHWWSKCRAGADWLVGRNGSEDPPSLQDSIDCAEAKVRGHLFWKGPSAHVAFPEHHGLG